MPVEVCDIRCRRRGVVLVAIAILAVGLVAVVGLAVDLGRMFIAKNEVQVFCDSAALAAALALDGSTAGITRAQVAVNSSANRWELGTTVVSNPLVRFAIASTGPWVENPNPATAYSYVRVTASVPVRLYFLPIAVAVNSHNVATSAAAGQVALSSLRRGLAPYTVVSTNTAGPHFGLALGNSYDLQWPQYNGTRAHCGPAAPDNCFNSPPCSGESQTSKAAVVTYWGASINGYWGGGSNSAIAASILDLIQLQPVAVGTNIWPLLSSGNKDSEKIYLDQRASQDTNTSDNTVLGYLASASRNSRRLIPALIVDPVDTSHTTVIGYGQFLLLASGTPSDYYKRTTTGNDPFCALYVGPYNIGSRGPGVGSPTGASQTRLVE